MENLEDINYLETAKEFAEENKISLENAVLLIMAEEINLLRKEVNKLKSMITASNTTSN